VQTKQLRVCKFIYNNILSVGFKISGPPIELAPPFSEFEVAITQKLITFRSSLFNKILYFLLKKNVFQGFTYQ